MTTRLFAIAALIVLSTACAKTVLTSPTSPTTTAALDVNSFTNLVLPGGSASRQVTSTAAGRIAVTLTSTTPPGTTLGVGIGIPRSNSQCALSAGIETTAGNAPQISMPVDGGSYCVKVYDTGSLTAPVRFTISISRP